MTFFISASFPRSRFSLVLLLILAQLFLGGLTQQVAADSGLFQYAVWRSNDRIVTAPYVDGVVAYIHWNVLEREPGHVDMDPILRIRSRVQQEGKRFILRVVTADHSPDWLYRLGVPRVIEKIDDQFRSVPLYWHPIYLQRLNSLVEKIAQQFDGDSSLAAIQIGIATYGEMLLGGREWLSKGFSPSIWTDTCRGIIDVYRAHFRKTPLVVMIMSQELPGFRRTDSMLPVAEYAASHGVGLQFNGLSPDNSYLWGLLDQPDPTSAISILRKFGHKVPVYLEMTSDKVDVRLSCLNALSEGASFLFIYTSLLEDQSLAPVFEFTRHFLGRTPSNSDAVWTLLRQTYPAETVRTGKKNYNFGLDQVDLKDLVVTCCDGSYLKIGSKTSALECPNGLPCRKTNTEDQFPHMVFRISSEFDPGPEPILTVIYADIGEDLWYPMYTEGKRLVRCRTIQKRNTGRWLQADFTLEGFSKGSPIDLVIHSNNDGDEFIHFVQLTRSRTNVIVPFSAAHVTP